MHISQNSQKIPGFFVTRGGAKNDKVNAMKLMAGRIDAFAAEERSGLKAIQIQNLSDKIQSYAANPISRHDIYYAFQNTGNGKKLAAVISKILGEMKRDGTYDNLMNN